MIDLIRQYRFAGLSGDFNPLHVDPLYARRTVFGEPVAHGVHLALWGLERGLRERPSWQIIRTLNVRFRNALPLNAPLSVETIAFTEDGFTLRPDGNYFELAATFERRRNKYWNAEIPREGTAMNCKENTFEESSRAEGEIDLYLDGEEFAAMFPETAARLPAVQIAQILATTRLTGMVCPGMRSIFHDLDLTFEENSERLVLHFRNHASDPRFSLIRLAVQGYGVQGTLAAFFDPAPFAQPSLAEVAGAVRPDEFRRQKALIIGGSRGLGELTAKMIVAGGGSVRLTCHRGSEDASRTIAELKAFGADAEGFAWDVLEPNRNAIAEALADWIPDRLYYFAAPHLVPSPKGDSFSTDKFDELCRYHVEGLRSTVDALPRTPDVGLRLFFPSTARIDAEAAEWKEFAAAKAEGEKTCLMLQEEAAIERFHAPRLPWLPTDQTVGLRSLKLTNALQALLPEVRRFASSDAIARAIR
jgi:hypothetical protein